MNHSTGDANRRRYLTAGCKRAQIIVVAFHSDGADKLKPAGQCKPVMFSQPQVDVMTGTKRFVATMHKPAFTKYQLKQKVGYHQNEMVTDSHG